MSESSNPVEELTGEKETGVLAENSIPPLAPVIADDEDYSSKVRDLLRQVREVLKAQPGVWNEVLIAMNHQQATRIVQRARYGRGPAWSPKGTWEAETMRVSGDVWTVRLRYIGSSDGDVTPSPRRKPVRKPKTETVETPKPALSRPEPALQPDPGQDTYPKSPKPGSVAYSASEALSRDCSEGYCGWCRGCGHDCHDTGGR